jgi:hypothetical protein
MAKKSASRARRKPSAASPRKPSGKAGSPRSPNEDPSSPKTTRPEAVERRPPSEELTNPDEQPRPPGRTFDAMPDRIDSRDWFYQPSLRSLPDVVVNCDLVHKVLDQGREGACTGYALAGVINALLRQRDVTRLVSPRMLYEMARRYDEWPGESYSGSSARGAMKGWVRHGVATAKTWPHGKHDLSFLQVIINKETSRTVADEAQATPGGAFYRVSHREIRDMHAAISEVGVVYCTLMVHDGWNPPFGDPIDVHYVWFGGSRTISLPVIQRRGRATDGHAVAIVGYTSRGFIVLNSWGETWASNGFALLPYEDFMLHATDVWVAQLGVPVEVDLWAKGSADSTAGVARASAAVPLSEIRPYVIDTGNSGRLSDSGDYWTTPRDVQRLFNETIPAATVDWPKKRILLYLHGGLNSELDVAKRIIAFRDVFLANEIYPIHLMWESGAGETLQDILRNLLGDERSGATADWMRKVREGLLEARDRSVELTVAKPGTAFWSTMKENARGLSNDPKGLGGLQLAAKYAMEATGSGHAYDLEFHVVGHSAGSIVAAQAMGLFTGLKGGVRFESLQLMAPAVRIDDFKRLVVPRIGKGCPMPTVYVLSDAGERDDKVGFGSFSPYGKSLLYLVSNAFEGKRGTPILGMARHLTKQSGIKADEIDPELASLFNKTVDGHQSLIVAGQSGDRFSQSRADSHGGFDNDVDTLNSVLRRILGRDPKEREFKVQDLQY